jgi:hypothetical protein
MNSDGEIREWQTPRELPYDFYQYKYYVTFNDNSTRWVSDPCARYGSEHNMDAAFVIGGSQPDDSKISPIKCGRKPLRDLVIYELMIDDFTSEFRGARAPLEYLYPGIYFRRVPLLIEQFNIDVIRIDNTVNFYNRGDAKGLPDLLEDIHHLMQQKNESHFSLTWEHLQMDAIEVTQSTHATSYWDKALYGECCRFENGQEFAEDYWLPKHDKGSSRRVQPRPLHWNYPNDKFGKGLVAVYTKLIKLRHEYEVLGADGFYPEHWDEGRTRFNPVGVGIDTERQLLVYRRYCVDSQNKLRDALVAVNFSGNDQWLDLTFPEDGQRFDLLSDTQWTITVTNRNYRLIVSSNWEHIFYNA